MGLHTDVSPVRHAHLARPPASMGIEMGQI